MDQSSLLSRSRSVSRRRFLGTAAAIAGSGAFSRLSWGQESPPLVLPAGSKRARVVAASSPHVVSGTAVHPGIFSEMLERSLTRLTDTSTSEAAWHTLLKPDDIIGLKFNRSAQEVLATTAPVAEAIIQSLGAAGWPTSQIIVIEAPKKIEQEYELRLGRIGYAKESVTFASGSDQFANVLSQITALIDVPFLKTHNIAGLTGALKNLSHGLVKHPARFHGNGCSPYIPDIVGTPEIRSKLRLCVVDALRIVYDGGPDATADSISDDGILLLSVDPVAVDSIGLLKINSAREVRGLTKVAEDPGEIRYLSAAHRQGLGIAAWHGIDLAEIHI